MPAKGLKVSKTKFEQTIEINELTGKDLDQDKNLKTEIAQAIVDYIVDRASSGQGVGGKDLNKKSYSKEYADSLIFKAAGKSKNDVNMTLTGDMLSSVEPLESPKGKIKIGISDETQIPKAYGHQSGFKGHPTIKGPKREWFGVTIDEIVDEVLPKFKKDLKDL